MDRRVTLVAIVAVGLTGCSTPEPIDREVSAAEAVSGAPTVPQRVDLHGEWARWVETPRLRERALAELDALPRFGFGRPASREEIAALDIDVMPDGTGLPAGQGSVSRGRELYDNQCVQCHGADGRGADFDALVGRVPDDRFDFSEDAFDYRPTVGNYWPYATTLYDYIHRAMPQAVPGSLPPGDVYSLVAYVLYLNDIVPENATLDQDSLPQIEMPSRDRFVYDDRAGGAELH